MLPKQGLLDGDVGRGRRDGIPVLEIKLERAGAAGVTAYLDARAAPRPLSPPGLLDAGRNLACSR